MEVYWNQDDGITLNSLLYVKNVIEDSVDWISMHKLDIVGMSYLRLVRFILHNFHHLFFPYRWQCELCSGSLTVLSEC